VNLLNHIQQKERRSNDFYLIGGGWIFITFLFVIRSYVAGQITSPFSLDNFLYEFICLSPWVLAVLLIKIINEKVNKHNGVRYFLIHTFMALILFLMHTIFQVFVNSLYVEQASFSYEVIKADFMGFFDIRLLLYMGIIIGYRYDKFVYKKGQILLHKEKLKTELERTKLSSIIYDVQPDFLIKNIDELSFYIYKDPNRAKDLLVTLSDLIRLLVRYSKKDNLTLEEDIKVYKHYVEFLSLKLNREIELVSKCNFQPTTTKISKTFFTIPLIDSIIEKCNDEDLNALNKIYYTFNSYEKTRYLEIRISDISNINLKILEGLVEDFKHNILKPETNSYDFHFDGVNKHMDQILFTIRFE